MRKWDSVIFKNNHLRLMMWHIFFAFFWLFIPIIAMVKIKNKGSVGGMLIPIIISFLPTLIHGALSYGSYKKIEISRKISEFIFGMMLLAFPVGTFLSMCFILPTLQWKNPEKITTRQVLNISPNPDLPTASRLAWPLDYAYTFHTSTNHDQ